MPARFPTGTSCSAWPGAATRPPSRPCSAATGEETFALEWHESAVILTAFSADGRRLATGSSDGVVRLWPWNALRDRVSGPGR